VRLPGSRYDTLLQVTLGQEEVEDVIFRDIHRTFPEHPRFLFSQGQQELFNVLKAYSMVDMEVQPCLCMLCTIAPHQTGLPQVALSTDSARGCTAPKRHCEGSGTRAHKLPAYGIHAMSCRLATVRAWALSWDFYSCICPSSLPSTSSALS
jgi:hypothetical protein